MTMNTCSPCRSRSSRVTQATRKVEVVVLDLEELSKWRGHVKREFVVVGIRLILLLDGEAAKQRRKSDLEVGVTGGLVKHNRPVPLKAKLGLIHPICWVVIRSTSRPIFVLYKTCGSRLW